jgi:hypothetical protein
MWHIPGPLAAPPVCTVCGEELTGDIDDDPQAPGGPVCGDCWRARADDELMWALDASDPDHDLW